jgi:L-iditol 2-dehydrogenase
MRAAFLVRPGEFEIRDLPRPRIEAGEALIRVKGCAVCGTDLRIFQHGHTKIEFPALIGHEVVGIVEEVSGGAGEGPEAVRRGDRVMVTPGLSCLKCDNCLRGLSCTNRKAIGYHYPGGFAEYLVVPAAGVPRNLFPLPNPLPVGQQPTEYVAAEPLACVLGGIERLGTLPPGGRGLIVGAGTVGVLLAKLLKSEGLGELVLADVSLRKLDLASRFLGEGYALVDSSAGDLRTAVARATGEADFDLVVTACSSPAAQEQSLQVIGTYGKILYFGGLPPDRAVLRFDSNALHYKQASVHGTYGSTLEQNRQAMKLIAGGLVRNLIGACFPLREIARAFQAALEGESLKVLVTP